MYATEHLVEIYYRQLGYFTTADIKVIRGNNRQFDIIAYNYKLDRFLHIEASVAHGQHWAASLTDIEKNVGYKFFGRTKNKRPDNPNTDYNKGKTYLQPIKSTYENLGIEYQKVIRVWCTWALIERDNDIKDWQRRLAKQYSLKPENFEILKFRDTVLPEVTANIGTAYYDDELIRILSLVKQYNVQVGALNNA